MEVQAREEEERLDCGLGCAAVVDLDHGAEADLGRWAEEGLDRGAEGRGALADLDRGAVDRGALVDLDRGAEGRRAVAGLEHINGLRSMRHSEFTGGFCGRST